MNPYEPPGNEEPSAKPKHRDGHGRYTARMEGQTLVVSRDAEMPAICMKCGKKGDIVRRLTQFQWTPLWARLLMFCIVGLIVMLITTKRGSLNVPLCVPCNERWSQARTVIIISLVGLIGGFIAMRTLDDHALGVALLFLGVGAFVILSITYVRPRVLRAKHIDETNIHLDGVDPKAAAEIVEASS